MWGTGAILGGRNNGNTCALQRSKLVANKEERIARASEVFALLRPATNDTTEKIYDATSMLQQDGIIPGKVELVDSDMHSSIIQTRRIRRALIEGHAGGFVLSRDLCHIQSGMPSHGRAGVEAYFTGVDTVGRNRNVLIARIKDTNGVIEAQRIAANKILDSLGLKMKRDRAPHITLGESKPGLSVDEREQIIDGVFDVIRYIKVDLLPIEIEHNGVRVPLECAKQLGDPARV